MDDNWVDNVLKRINNEVTIDRHMVFMTKAKWDSVQQKLQQLRAEREGFTDTLDSLELALFDVAGALEQTKLDFIHQQIIETLGEIRQAKSKLTDSAQRGEG